MANRSKGGDVGRMRRSEAQIAKTDKMERRMKERYDRTAGENEMRDSGMLSSKQSHLGMTKLTKAVGTAVPPGSLGLFSPRGLCSALPFTSSTVCSPSLLFSPIDGRESYLSATIPQIPLLLFH